MFEVVEMVCLNGDARDNVEFEEKYCVYICIAVVYY
jgi:hypothetical protein